MALKCVFVSWRSKTPSHGGETYHRVLAICRCDRLRFHAPIQAMLIGVDTRVPEGLSFLEVGKLTFVTPTGVVDRFSPKIKVE